MYKKIEKPQLVLDFALPFGGHLESTNRWIKLAQLIPWDEYEDHYASLFSLKEGARAKPFRMALGALLIKEKLKLSDEETVEQIKENPYLQYFIGFKEYSADSPFDPSMMVHFRKRISHEMLCEINLKIVERSLKLQQEKEAKKKNDDDSGSLNRGKLVLDATVAPADITYPTDSKLLNESRVWTERIIDVLHRQGGVSRFGKKPRNYREIARKQYANFTKQRKPRRKAIRKIIKKQLGYIRRNLESIDQLIAQGASLSLLTSTTYKKLLVISEVFRQQSYLYETQSLRIEGRIVSLSQPHIRPIKRGKANADTEFGAKLSLSYVEGYTFIDHFSWDNFNESTDLIAQVERYKSRTGYYPESLHVDQIYRTRNNLKWCRLKGIRVSGPALGRRSVLVDKAKYQKQMLYDYRYRNRVEGVIGNAKRKYSLDRLSAKLASISFTQMALIVMVMNLGQLLRWLFIFVYKFFLNFGKKLYIFKNSLHFTVINTAFMF